MPETTQQNPRAGLRVEVVDQSRVVQVGPPTDEAAITTNIAPERPATAANVPPASQPIAASELVLRDSTLLGLYRGLDARLVNSGERLLELARADAAKAEGVAHTHSDADYRTLVARNVQLRTLLAENFSKIDQQIVDSPEKRATLLEGATEFSQGFGQQIDSLNNTNNPADPFDAKKFFDGIEPTLRQMSTTLGSMTRTTVDAVVTGLKSLGSALMHPRRATGNIAASAREAGGNFMEHLNPGTIGGSLAGAAGGFAIANMFGGGGPLKYLLMLLLIPGGMLLGASKLGGPLNNFFGGIFGRRQAEADANAAAQGAERPAPLMGRVPEQQGTFTDVDQLSPEDLRRARVAVPSSVAGSIRGAQEADSAQSIYEAGYARGLRVYPQPSFDAPQGDFPPRGGERHDQDRRSQRH